MANTHQQQQQQQQQHLSMDDYVNFKTKMQEYINSLDQSNLLHLFNIFKKEQPAIQYTINKNGYFVDIKQLSLDMLRSIEQQLREINGGSGSEAVEL